MFKKRNKASHICIEPIVPTYNTHLCYIIHLNKKDMITVIAKNVLFETSTS